MNNIYRAIFLIALVLYFTGCASLDGTYDSCEQDGLEDCAEFFYEKGIINE